MRSKTFAARQPLDDTAIFCCDAAVDTKEDRLLPFLDVDRFDGRPLCRTLDGFKAVVIGAGPAGLVFARAAAAHGADVLVLEQAGDPRGTEPGYTDRSFNLTLDCVGRQVLGDPRSFQGGIWLNGRAIHSPEPGTPVTYGSYGQTSEVDYVSIPRPRLRQNLTVLAEEAGARVVFDCCVTGADTDSGEVAYVNKQSGRPLTVRGDLVVFGDGLHSLANQDLDRLMSLRLEEKTYFTCLIPARENAGLSLRHIHFWHEPSGEGYSIGIPNADGTVALLLTSRFTDIDAKTHPFPSSQEAKARLQRDFPSLYRQAPFLDAQLPRRRRGQFWYKNVRQYHLGNKGVIVGDAGCVVPPWAGYGANSAMYAAASLAYQLSGHAGDAARAIRIYEQQQLAIARSLMGFVEDQGEFLSSEVVGNPSGRSEDALGRIIKAARAS